MASPVNNLVNSRVTRASLKHQQTHVELPDDHLTAPCSSSSTQTTMPYEEITAVINTQMSRMSQPMTHFDGQSSPVAEWLAELDSVMAITGRTKTEEKRHMLTTHLSGDAKSWLRLQPQATKDSYTAIRQGLMDRFSPSKEALFARKSSIWGMKQRPGQPYLEFLQALQETAYGTEIADNDLVQIAIAGAQQALKPHLAGCKAKTIDELRKLPAVQPGMEPTHAIDPALVAAVMAQLNLQGHHACAATPSPAPSSGTQPAPAPEKRVTFRDRKERRRREWERSGSSSRERSMSRSYSRSASRDRDSRRREYGREDKKSHESPAHWVCGKCGTRCRGGQKCPASGKVCARCNRLHHFTKMCRARVNSKKEWDLAPVPIVKHEGRPLKKANVKNSLHVTNCDSNG